MTYKLLAQTTLGEPQYVASTGYYYGDTVAADPFNEMRIDLGFTDLAPSQSIEVIEQLPDGKIIIGGDIGTLGGTYWGIKFALLDQNGALSTLNNGANDPYFDNYWKTAAVQEDGKIVIGGTFTEVDYVTRNKMVRLYTYDNALNVDMDFDPNCNNTVRKVLIQEDGKILICGDFTTVGGTTRNRIARLNASGTLDTGFNPNLDATCYDMALQSDGRIIIGGAFTTVGGTSESYLARLNQDGTLDTSFNQTTFDMAAPTFTAAVYAVTNYKNGQLIVASDSTSKLVRLNADGTKDTSFSSTLTTYPSKVKVQDDGKIIVSSAAFNDSLATLSSNTIFRLNDDGSLDTNFEINCNDVLDFIIQPDGKIVIVGTFTNADGSGRSYMARYKKSANNAPYTELYECDTTAVLVDSIFIANHQDFMNSVDIAVLPANEDTVEERHHIVWDNFIKSNDYIQVYPRIPLNIGDRVFGYSTVDELMSVNIFGKVIS